MDKTMRKLLLSKISFIAVGTAAHAGDAPAAPAAAVTSFLDGEPGSITVAGITVYGTVDVGAVYESHGTRQGNGLLYLGPEYLIQKNSNKSQAVNASNGLSQSTVGIKGKQAIKDLTGFDALPGWSLLFDLQVGFNPASCEPANAVGSLTSPDGSRFLALDTKGIADTSNFGGTQGSVLTSTSFTAGAFALSLRYNFLTNENANDATYNDFAQIRLVSASGAVLTTAKTIDTFANLASSTNTGYVRETSRQTLSFDLSPWKGQQVKLQFVVSDKGDTAIDSVLLLDDIVSVAASTALIANGNFEAGNLSGWTVTQGGQFPKIVSSGAAGSAFALQMGDGGTGLGGGNTASIQQAISVPASGAPVLSFNYKVEGNDGINWDWMKLYLDGKEIAVWATDTGGWQTFTYDLSAYKGKLVTLKFSSWTTDTFNQVNYFLDNVKITT